MKFELGKVIKTFKSKKGNQVVFRYPQKDDFQAVWGFACDLAAEDTFVELSGSGPTREEEQKWFGDVLKNVSERKTIHITVVVGGTYAGNAEVRRGKYRKNHVGEISLSLAPAFRDEGIGTQLLKALIDESRAFGLRLLTINCFENNQRALHVYEKLGFKIAGIIPGALAYKGTDVGEVKLFLPLI